MINKKDKNEVNKYKSTPLKVFLMGGTKDSTNIIKFLKEEYDSSYILTTTTTEHGANIAKKAGSDETIAKPLSKEEIVNILLGIDIDTRSAIDESKHLNLNIGGNVVKFDIFIDATHPFAVNATKTAIESVKIANIPYIRFERPSIDFRNFIDKDRLHFLDSFQEAGEIIATDFKGKNVLHLAGVNTIGEVLKSNEISKENFFARVLPVKSSIEKCNNLGISGEHIIAMQGIFSKEFNKELMKEFNIQVIVTKESGAVGGVPSKITAAHELGIDIILVTRPKIATLEESSIVYDLSQLKMKLNSSK
jgi:precorrin-6A/cobalt-precorrin-6A reductase